MVDASESAAFANEFIGCWEISGADYPFEDLKADRDWCGICSSALAAVDGAWTIVVSQEGHGVISGPIDFVTELQKQLPGWGGSLPEIIELLFIGRAEHAASDLQLLAMIRRLYGDEAARQGISASGIDMSSLSDSSA